MSLRIAWIMGMAYLEFTVVRKAIGIAPLQLELKT